MSIDKNSTMRKPIDLREHARLSLRFLRNAVSPTRPGLPYFWIDFLPNPPQFAHEMVFDDLENVGRWLYGIACAQRVAGSSEAEATRELLLREIDRRIAGPYHLLYSSEYSAERSSRPRYTWLWGDRSVLEGWIQCWRSRVFIPSYFDMEFSFAELWHAVKRHDTAANATIPSLFINFLRR